MERHETNVCQVVGDKRVRPTLSSAKERVSNFAEAEPVFTMEQAVAEAKRCTQASACYYCEVCELMCPDLAITRNATTNQIVIDLDYCKGCGLCVHYCPHDAIKMVVDE